LNPQLYIIAGPNGAGKTTFAGQFLPLYTKSREFVNADNIAQRLSPSNPEAAAFRAGREMLKRIDELAGKKADFSIETTLAGKSYLPWLRNLKARGYEIHLYFLWLPDVQMSIDRVADRVRKGGHDIPESVIRRRYTAGIKNLFQVYRPILDSWSLFDNSRQMPYLIAKESKLNLVVLDTELFERCSKMATKPTDEPLRESAEMPDWMPALNALRLAKVEVIKEHLRTGHPLIIWRNGKVYHQPPEEAKRELEQAAKSDPWMKAAL
jgi:predicted ABC-type ATPase